MDREESRPSEDRDDASSREFGMAAVPTGQRKAGLWLVVRRTEEDQKEL